MNEGPYNRHQLEDTCNEGEEEGAIVPHEVEERNGDEERDYGDDDLDDVDSVERIHRACRDLSDGVVKPIRQSLPNLGIDPLSEEQGQIEDQKECCGTEKEARNRKYLRGQILKASGQPCVQPSPNGFRLDKGQELETAGLNLAEDRGKTCHRIPEEIDVLVEYTGDEEPQDQEKSKSRDCRCHGGERGPEPAVQPSFERHRDHGECHG